MAKDSDDVSFIIKNMDDKQEGGELVMLVDENNMPILDEKKNPVGAPRKEVVDDKLWHRCSCVFVIDEENNFYV